MIALCPRTSFLPVLVLLSTACALLSLSAATEEYQVLPMDRPEFNNGCSELERLPGTATPAGPWMGLVTKEGCSVSIKHRNLAKLGAAGMIIRSAVSLEPFSPDKTSFYIIPVGASFYNMFARPEGGNSSLSPVKIVLPARRPLPLLQVSYVIFLVLMIFVFPVLFERLEENAPSKTLSPKELAGLLHTEYQALPAQHQKYDECPICFDRFGPSSGVRLLRCFHYFHLECIDPWLLSRSARCPVCNHELSSA